MLGTAVGLRSAVGAAVGLWRLIVGANVGAAVGARHDEREDGAMTARESSTARGTARFFAVEAGAEALFCGEAIEWTIVEVSDAMAEGGDRLVLRERRENTGTAGCK